MRPRHPFPVRLRQIRSALRTDQVLTASQVERYYDTTLEEIRPHVTVRHTPFRPLKGVPRELDASFLLPLEQAEEARWLPSWKLAHQAGTAELRHALGIPTTHWELEGGFDTHRPDAVIHTPAGMIAVEHDSGYPPAIVAQKLKAFEAFSQVIWGTASKARRGHLQSRHAHKAVFLHVDITKQVQTHADMTSAIKERLQLT